MLFNRNDLASTKAELPSPATEAWDDMFWLVRYVVHAWASMMYAFTRRNFGRNYFNWWGMSGLAVLSFWAVVQVPIEESVGISVMMAAFVLLALWHRAHSPREFQGQTLHSRYTGWPLLCDVLPISEVAAKSFIEPGVIAMIGWGISNINQGLGLFILLGAVACILDWVYLSRRDYSRASRIHDAEREQDRVMDTYDRYFKK